jgi:hypothetical protein
VTYRSPPKLTFEEKAEVLMERVKADDDLEILWSNDVTNINPIFRIEQSVFEGVSNLEDGIKSETIFLFDGKNSQPKKDDEDDCLVDFKG